MNPSGFLVLIVVAIIDGQKLVLIIADGLSGTHFHRFSALSGLRIFEEEGVWSTQLIPVFPTLPLPNRHTLLTGMLPRKHGMVGDYLLNWRTGRTFLNFTVETDFDRSEWWTIDPLYVTATRAKALVAMFFFPECKYLIHIDHFSLTSNRSLIFMARPAQYFPKKSHGDFS
ncbi:Type I phosphodiesterase nucleotide pyrophosphatase phosphate transferase domain containing protein [Trichostrongylus colubriformis]|uniref:glycerophosphocholine cholinephosphodiesterase n=1 Tax=Trichostrongylus colubriformis TaxID=6319 RepID=A0AAN8IF04_TRICO